MVNHSSRHHHCDKVFVVLQAAAADSAAPLAVPSQDADKPPHLSYMYKDRLVVDDALALIIHHARRQASTQKKDKQMIKQLMKQNVQRLFHRPSFPLSDDEDGEC